MPDGQVLLVGGMTMVDLHGVAEICVQRCALSRRSRDDRYDRAFAGFASITPIPRFSKQISLT